MRWALPPLHKDTQINADSDKIADRINEAMLHIGVGGDTCKNKSIPLVVKFNALNSALDFSRSFEVNIPADGSHTDIYTPLYELHYPSSGKLYFSPDAIELKIADYSCINEVNLLDDKNFNPLWLTLTIPENWKQQRLYQTCRSPMCRT